MALLLRRNGDGVRLLPLAVSSGVLYGSTFLGMGLAARHNKRCREAAKHVRDFFPGFTEKPKGLAIGFGWGFLEGFVMVLAVGGLYQLLKRVIRL